MPLAYLELSKLLNFRFIYDLNEFDNKCEAIDLIFSKYKIKLVLSNMAIGVDEYLLRMFHHLRLLELLAMILSK